MLSNTLNTNEIKDASGAEVEFERIAIDNASTTFKQVDEDITTPNRMSISHQHVGSGVNAVRRSLVRFDLSVVNSTTGQKGVCSAYCNLVVPEGMLENMNAPTKVLAQLVSFVASLGASTTILYDGTGNGAASLLNETV